MKTILSAFFWVTLYLVLAPCYADCTMDTPYE